MGDKLYENIRLSKEYILHKLSEFDAKTAIVTGTGIRIDAEIISEIPYADIPYFPPSTVNSHQGKLLHALIDGTETIILSGRWHYYEGYSTKEITFPIRVLKALGISQLILTNVSGGLNPDYSAGDIVALKDHIYLLSENPLRGQHDDRLGVRFLDMAEPYDHDFRLATQRAMRDLQLTYKEGVYVCIPGPSLETKAEYRYFNKIGADLIGMSTIPEVLVARHSSMKVLVLSIISNECHPDADITETTIEEVIAVAKAAVPKLNGVIKKLLSN